MEEFIRRNSARKQAMLSVELTLSIILAVGVLFLILGIFNNNLSQVAQKSGMQKLFKDGATSNATAQGTYTDSQDLITIAGEQGQMTIEQYRDSALDTINRLKDKNPLNDAEILDLAKAIVMYGISAADGAIPGNRGGAVGDLDLAPNVQNVIPSVNKNEVNVIFREQSIRVKTSDYPNGKPINWGNYVTPNYLITEDSPTAKLSILQQIQIASFQ